MPHRQQSASRSGGTICFAPSLSPIPEEAKERTTINDTSSAVSSNHSKERLQAGSQCHPESPTPVHVPFKHTISVLYGRDRELEILRMAYQKSRSNSREIVLIRGRWGIGKTALANALRPLVEGDGGVFIVGKFEERMTRKPYAAFVEAFAQFTEWILASQSTELLQLVRGAIHQAVGREGQLLIDMIPSLEKIIGRQDQSSQVNGSEALHRFQFLFSKFLTAIASLSIPFVILMDDLQWADAASLDLLQSLLLYPSAHQEIQSPTSSLLFIMALRDTDDCLHRLVLRNEVQESPLSDELHTFETYLNRFIAEGKEGILNISDIYLDNLSLEDTNKLLAGHLQISPHVTTSLAPLIYDNTSGNVFHVWQYLHVLIDEGLLFQEGEGQWRWNYCDIQSRDEFLRSVDDIVKHKLHLLPSAALEVLKVAACLGNEIDEASLAFILGSSEISKHLEFAEERGLISCLPNVGRYRFAHHRIQQATLALIEDPPALCLRIGRLLLSESNLFLFDSNLFLLVSMLNLGSSAIEDQQERCQVAELNLRAGEKSKTLTAFPDASRYFAQGISLIRHGRFPHWSKCYELSLRLFGSYAESELYNQNFLMVREVLNEVFDNAMSWEDRHQSYCVLLHSMGQQDNLQGATNAGIAILRDLGEIIPRTASKLVVLKDLLATRRSLQGVSDKELLDFGSMTDARKFACSQILSILFVYTYQARSPFTTLFAFRSIKLCLRYGHFNCSAQAFAMYGMVMCGLGYDITAGTRFGKLAISMLDKSGNDKQLLPAVFCIVYGGIDHWTNPLRHSLDHLQHAARVAMETGNVEFAMIAAGFRCTYSLFAGVSISAVESELLVATRQMRMYKQENTFLMTSLPLQFIHNITGRAENPKVLTGDIVNFDLILKEAGDASNMTVVAAIYLYAADLAYMFGDYELASVMAEENKNLQKTPSALFAVVVVRFKEGLIAVALARSGVRRRANIKLAKQAHGKIKKWAKNAPMNFEHKALLMEAELKSIHGGRRAQQVVLDLYDRAIAGAEREGYVHEAALACEKAGDYLFGFEGAADKTISYWHRSHDLYLEWGATSKADHLNASVSTLVHGKQQKLW